MSRKVRFLSYGDTPFMGDLTVGKVYDVHEDRTSSYIIDDRDDYRYVDAHNWEEIVEDEVLSGGSSSYYTVKVTNPVQDTHDWYMAECYDLIKALKLNWEEANIFKEIWRTGNARNENGKEGNTDLRAAEKMFFFAEQNLKFIQMENNNA